MIPNVPTDIHCKACGHTWRTKHTAQSDAFGFIKMKGKVRSCPKCKAAHGLEILLRIKPLEGK